MPMIRLKRCLLQLLRCRQGIAGMEYLRKDGVCRPLLGNTCREIENTPLKRICTVEDSSNASLDSAVIAFGMSYSRCWQENTIRMSGRLLRSAAIARSAEGYITTEADRFLQNIAELSENLVVITIESFLEAP